jgi:ATP-dependent exoDNAse (exonuclease V) alpha subunit
MAIYHLSVKPISRAGGRSATAASAYRSATRIRDEQTGEVFDYSRKRGVEHSQIILPEDKESSAPQWMRDREQLWNAAERAESRKDSRVAREYEVALPHELQASQRLLLTRAFASELANRYGCAVDFAIHRPHQAGDERNYHAHILATTRKVSAAGLTDKTTVELGDKDRFKLGLQSGRKEITDLRALWKDLTNAQLREQGLNITIDHRSLKAQGVDRTPLPHLGPVVTEMWRRGKDSTVLERIRDEQRQDAERRLTEAAERSELERESSQLRQTILCLETDLKSALAEREAQRDAQQARATPISTRNPLEDARRASQNRWLQNRELLINARPEPAAERAGLILTPEDDR